MPRPPRRPDDSPPAAALEHGILDAIEQSLNATAAADVRPRRPMLTLPTIALLGSTLLATQQAGPAERAEIGELFAVLDAIDPLDTSRLPFVRVAIGQRDEVPAAEPWAGTYRHGFLHEADGHRFRVRYVELDTESLAVSPPRTPERFRVGFEPADLREYADELAAALRASAREHEPHSLCPSAPLSSVTVALLTARACARSGHAEHVERLLAAVRARRPDAARPLLQTYELPADLATALALAHGDPRRSWKALLALHVAWLRAFPDAHARETVTQQGNDIRRMLERRAAADALPALGERPTDAQLLEALRELPARHTWPPPGPPDPATLRAHDAFDELARRGLAAVPALLAALDDRSPTRCVGHTSRFGGAVFVRSLGDRAGDVLVAIAGERADWRTWFAAASRDGLRASVRRALARGTPEAASAWLRHWPDEPGPVLALARAADPNTRRGLAWTVLCSGGWWTRSHASTLLNSDALREHPQRRSACENLLALGDAGGFRSIAADWRAGRLAAAQAAGHLGDMLSAGVAVLPLLQRHLDEPDVRTAFVRALAGLPREALLAAVPPGERAAFSEQLHTCLVPLLRDSTPLGDITVLLARSRRVTLLRATQADVAACKLRELWPERYPFDAARSARSRARQVAALRGDPGSATETPAERLVHELRAGNTGIDGVERLAACRAPALPWIHELLRDLPRLPQRTRLERLAVELAREVTAVTFAPSAAALEPAQRDPLLLLRGEPAAAVPLLRAAAAAARAPTAAGRAVQLRVERVGDQGTTIHCELCAAEPEIRRLYVRATAGVLTLHDGVVDADLTGDLEAAAPPPGLARTLAAIDRALGARSTTAVAVTIRVAAR